jgi:hypothetical protein
MAADEAEAKVDPRVAQLEAVLAAIGLRHERADLVEVGAGDDHRGASST